MGAGGKNEWLYGPLMGELPSVGCDQKIQAKIYRLSPGAIRLACAHISGEYDHATDVDLSAI
jgi:hypothetical protein